MFCLLMIHLAGFAKQSLQIEVGLSLLAIENFEPVQKGLRIGIHLPGGEGWSTEVSGLFWTGTEQNFVRFRGIGEAEDASAAGRYFTGNTALQLNLERTLLARNRNELTFSAGLVQHFNYRSDALFKKIPVYNSAFVLAGSWGRGISQRVTLVTRIFAHFEPGDVQPLMGGVEIAVRLRINNVRIAQMHLRETETSRR